MRRHDHRSLLRLLLLTVLIPALALLVAATPATLTPPVAKKIQKTEVLHGETRQDDYFWLREKSDPEVIKYLESENAYTAAMLKPTEKLQEDLYKEMLGRIKETDLSVPYRKGGYFYYSRTEQGKQYPIHCRKKGSLDAPEEITIDLNEAAKGHSFLSMSEYEVSDDGKLLAYALDFTGFRQYTMFVKNLATGQTLSEKVERVDAVAWAADNQALFYVVEDDTKRPCRMYRHRLGATGADDLIYEEKDEMFNLNVGRTRSGAFILAGSGSHTATEFRYLPAGTPDGEWKIISPREKEHEYDVEHAGDLFYIRTNSGGRNFRLVTAPVTSPGRENWKEIVPYRASVMIENIDSFAKQYVLYEREDGLQQITITDLNSGTSQRIQFPEAAYAVFPSNNPEFDSQALRYSYQSHITPSSVFDYDFQKRQSRLLKQTEVLGGYDPTQYMTERTYATASDGARVPIALVYRKGVKKDGSAPMMLYAYGSYGFPSPITFSSSRLSLLDRGMIWAVAGIRGGGEMGKAWHDQGRMMNKRNTFTDFIASAEYLIAQKYTSKERLVIMGGSAGGLLVGAVTNMRPDLFAAVIAKVPFVDVINTMLDTTLPLTVGEFEEWGNPQNKDDYNYMKSYCPYSNIGPKNYPAMLVETSLNDSQVMYHEPAKYVAKMRALKTGNNPLLLRVNMSAGHGGSSGRYDALKETAIDYAFILSVLHMDNAPPLKRVGDV